MLACLLGNLIARVLIASTIVTLKSSLISLMKDVICFIKRSTLDSLHVLRRVLMANVPIERLVLVTSASISGFQARTASGLNAAKLCSILIAANLVTGRGEVRNSWRT